MNSSCRLCGQRGHWKAECPMRGTSTGSAPSTSGGNTAPTTTVIADSEAMDSLPLEFVSSARSSDAHPIPCTDHPDVQCALFATHGTHGVLDLGASKTVIGSNHVADLLNGLDPAIKEKVTKTSCDITFKFGNEGVLHSSYAIVLPIGRLKLKVAIVKGGTPFLLSNSLMRALRARIDCENRCLISPLLDCEVPLKLTSRGLFLIDVNSLAVAARPTLEQSVGEPTQIHQTFVTVRQKEKIAGSVPVQQDQYQSPSPLQVPFPFSESKGEPHDTLNVHATQPETMVAVLKSQSHPSPSESTECPTLPAVDHDQKVQFGQKHLGRPFHQVWEEDQEWISFIASKYAESTKMSHRLIVRYITLRVEQHERSQTPIRVAPPAESQAASSQLPMSLRPVPKIKAKPKAASQIPHSEIVHLPDMEAEEEEWNLGTYQSGYTEPTPMNADMMAMQTRMLHLENALTQVIQHMEHQAGIHQPVPEDQEGATTWRVSVPIRFDTGRSLPAEGEPEGPELPSDLTHIQNQIDRMNQLPTIDEHVPLENIEEPIESPAHMPEPAVARERLGSTAESLAQPDQEPGINSHQPSINSQESGSDSEQTTVQLLCIDDDDEVYFSTEHPDFAFRCEFDVPAHAVPKDANAESDQVAWTLLSSGSAKQRTEVKMSELTPQEKTLFEQAKQKEIDNWIQTNTITKVLKNQIPPEQAAFLQGRPQSDRIVGLDPVPELRRAMGMSRAQTRDRIKWLKVGTLINLRTIGSGSGQQVRGWVGLRAPCSKTGKRWAGQPSGANGPKRAIMMPRDEALPPVPPDAADGPVISASQLPWAAIPRFQPGITNVQEYVKKLEFLAAMWPIEYLDLLAPRAALLVEGSAFAAISKLDAQKLKVKSLDGIKTLVNAIGGSWGATDFQERFEYFERALYGTIQKQDESNDSFIARMEAVFSELLSRKTSLEEIQAYVLLRQSTLPADDKKRVLLENPQLSYPPVMKALRLLGSKFFQEVQTGKATQKTKVYDTMVTEEASDGSCMVSQSMLADDDEVSSEFLEALVSQDDPDAVAVQAFETEFEDFVQDTPDMQVALISYLEARQRLQDKRRGRGFWPAHGTGKSKGKSKFNKGSFKGQHQGRQNLLAKIAKSRCRNCNQLGHWKAECPMKDRDSSTAPSTSHPPAAAANLVESELREAGGTMDDAEIFTDADLMKVHRDFFDVSPCVQECFMSVHFSWNNPQNKTKLSNSMKRLNAVQRQPMSHSYNQCFMPSAPAECNRVQFWHPKHVMQPARTEKMEYLPEMSALHSSEAKPAHAILDTGASRCIIGTQPLSRLLQRLPSDVRSTVQRRESKIKFRFGNNQTLTSMYRVLLPLYGPNCEKVWLGVEVVEGTTPFLFSKRAFKQLGLYLIDIMSNREAAIHMLKETANTIMGTLTLVLQVSMSMIEIRNPDAAEEETMPQLTNQLRAMNQEMMRQRALLQQLAENQNAQIPGSGSLPLRQLPLPEPVIGTQDVQAMPVSATLSDEDDLDNFSMVSSLKGPKNSQALRHPAKEARKTSQGAPSNHHQVPMSPPPPVETVEIYGNSNALVEQSALRLTLAEWGQRKISWGRKHPGRTYYQVLSEDMGYFEWSLSRYNSLPAPQQDFVDFCRAQLEASAAQDGDLATPSGRRRLWELIDEIEPDHIFALAQALCATHLAAVQEAFANDEEPPAKRKLTTMLLNPTRKFEQSNNPKACRNPPRCVKDMLTRLDTDHRMENMSQFDEMLMLCCQSKNALAKHRGYSPEQIVLGKATRLPASLSSDDSTAAHSLALGDDLDCDRFRSLLEKRTKARQAFILADNAESLRRATLRQSRPTRGPYMPGQLVLYWTKRSVPNRSESGRWHGPARVIVQEGSSIVWLSHANRLIRRAPESLRPASLREWNASQDQNPNSECAIRDNMHHMPIPQNSPSIVNNQVPPDDDPYSPSILDNNEVPPDHVSEQPEHEASHPPTIDSEEETPTAATDETETEFQEDGLLLQMINLTNHEDADPEQPAEEALHVFDTFYPAQDATANETICLAEDGMPYIDSPLDCNTEECFVLEIPMKSEDVLAWNQEVNPSEMICVAAAGQRARSEVQVKYLTDSERKLFDIAKDNELSCWISTNALRPILRKSLNPDQILRSRWVLTWKNVEANDQAPAHKKAKARLVVLGYQDPQLTSVARDSPTLTKEGRNTILQLVASCQWDLISLDIKTAFLRGKADEQNPLAMEPPDELRKKLQLSKDQVCALVGNAYGRVDAPLLFYKELSKQLKTLNFRTHPLEPCVFILESGEGSQRKLHGALGVHVDDGVGGGDEYFHQQIQALSKVLPFGSFKTRKFVFTGIELEQLPDCSIRASQADYVHRILPIDIGKPRREQISSPVTDSEKSKLRGLIGSLQYAVTHTRPDLAARLGEVQTDMSSPTVQTLMQCNKVLREAQEHSDVQICFRSIPMSQVTHVSFGDASFASPKQLNSFQGLLHVPKCR
ncbi:unnamed protein product [Cladocopium goreaui]|uniref:Copia protein n=1 Tax=Cladocopium goreaui TaxID=2562237 RepID=A0A9P1BRG8_9DINO|nr:unnamed protein product [Cladocopium goreaui]